jgi:glycosyltransferase involved in cell wall biosynthesis
MADRAGSPQAPAVVHVTEDMAPLAGGVPAVVRQLSRRLAAGGARVGVVHASGDARDLQPQVQTLACPPQGLRRAWSHGPGLRPGLAATLGTAIANGPVVHVHGVWAAPQLYAARAARAMGLPFVFTAHGMLEPWLWTQQGWRVRAKKAVYWRSLAQPALQRATVVHAITALERDHVFRLLPKTRIEVIPNAIEVGAAPTDTGDRERTVLFLGRIEPKKGVDILVRAFAEAGLSRDWALVVAGPAWSEPYLAELKRIAAELGLRDRVRFPGPVFGDAKRRLLETAWVMAAPSHSEVVGLVNLEAGERELPSITTHQTGLADWEEGGGILVQPEVADVARALRQACGWSASERRERGVSSRGLVQKTYSWEAVMPLWQSLYAGTRSGK